ncbi:unnamed protein product [Rhodiola kirilowii]
MALFLLRSLASSNALPKRNYLLPMSISSREHIRNWLRPAAFTHPESQRSFNTMKNGVVGGLNLNYVKLCRYGLFDYIRVSLVHTISEGVDEAGVGADGNEVKDACEDVWAMLKDEARSAIEKEPILSNYYQSSVFRHTSLEGALASYLSLKLTDSSLPGGTLNDLFVDVLVEDKDIIMAVEEDLRAVKERDPACGTYLHCMLNFKGFLACQAYRIAHKLWLQERKLLALLIQSRISEVFAMDIHPGARIGHGILFDHATGIVVGETAVIGNDVSILHNVTLGGTGKMSGDRHPKIGDGVLIGAGTSILGNIRIGEGAKIGAGSVVLKDVQPWTTVVGNPARIVGGKENPVKLDKKPSLTMDHTSNVVDFYDYCV